MTQTEIDFIIAVIKYTYTVTKNNPEFTQTKVVSEVVKVLDSITEPSTGIFMPTELYDKMITEGI